MKPLLQPIADYYAEKVATHGPTPQGADWKSAESQSLRFSVLVRMLAGAPGTPSLDDYGCGYGALLDHLRSTRQAVDYLGLDASSRMVEQARRCHPGDEALFVEQTRSPRVSRFAVASGIFNVRLGNPESAWEGHILETLDAMHELSVEGFAFNCLSTYSDPPLRKEYLYYGDPCHYFDLCKRRYAAQVSLLHDYGLYEFTLIVRKSPAP
jgi:SAM-dependent methyltransferase